MLEKRDRLVSEAVIILDEIEGGETGTCVSRRVIQNVPGGGRVNYSMPRAE